MNNGTVLTGSYDYRLVALSTLIAVLASYVALDLAARIAAARGRLRQAWLTGGAISMGFGISSMHYIGMLAFKLPVPVLYDVPTVLISLLAAILGSATALFAACRARFRRAEAALSSLVMGSAIAGMHHIGMAAMRLPANCRYSPLVVGFSILIAIVASLAAAVFSFGFRDETRTSWAKVTSATLMGIAIAATPESARPPG